MYRSGPLFTFYERYNTDQVVLRRKFYSAPAIHKGTEAWETDMDLDSPSFMNVEGEVCRDPEPPLGALVP